MSSVLVPHESTDRRTFQTAHYSAFFPAVKPSIQPTFSCATDPAICTALGNSIRSAFPATVYSTIREAVNAAI